MKNNALTLKTKLGFGAADIGGNVFFTAISLLLLIFLTDQVGISATQAGIIIAIGKVWDAITDPLVGYLSDHTKSRWGRRRPWLLFGGVPLMLCMFFQFLNPQSSNQSTLFIWGLLSFCLLNTVFTIVNIPYSALTPDITDDYHERSTLNGYRFGCAVIGTILGGVVSGIIVNAFSDKNTGYAVMGGIFGAIMMITAWITFFSVRENPALKEENNPGFITSYSAVLKNIPFLLLMLTFTFHLTAITIIMGVAIYFFKYIHHNEDLLQMAMGIMLVTAFVFIPVSVWISGKTSKKAVYLLGLGMLSAVSLLMYFTGHLFPYSYSLGLMILMGISLGFLYAMPWAMVPDTIDWHYHKNGFRTEGAFYGLWTFSVKMGQALAMGITGFLLDYFGYVANAEQSSEALLGIRYLLGPVPVFFLLLAFILLWKYPIHRSLLEKIQAENAAQKQENSH